MGTSVTPNQQKGRKAEEGMVSNLEPGKEVKFRHTQERILRNRPVHSADPQSVSVIGHNRC